MSWFSAANAWVGSQLGQASGPGAIGLLVLAGALASLLPCVYPLYPITAAVLGKRSSPLGRFAHPLAYYLGLATMYLTFGVIAGLSGGAFNEVLRLPLTNLLIAALLLCLALATAGLLHFPVLQPQTDSSSDSLFATVTMGAGAGLLSSACVGPVVVSVLVALAANTASLSALSVLLAAGKMFAFGLGVGVPFLLIGVFGLALPRGGRWMLTVQYFFAVLIIYFALGYAVKGLEGLGLADQAPHILLALSAVVLGTFFLLNGERPLTDRVKMSLASGALVSGLCGMLVLTGGSRVGTANAQSSSASSNVEEKAGLTWHLDKTAAYQAAALQGKPVFIDFYGSWCTNCRAFEQRTTQDAQLKAALAGAVLLKIYDTAPLFQTYKHDPRFPELKVGLPFFLITDSQENIVYKTNDFTKTEEMILFLEG